MGELHIVRLSRKAVALLGELRPLTGPERLRLPFATHQRSSGQ
jgi:hypothetical protein